MKIFFVVYCFIGLVLWLKDTLEINKKWKISIKGFIMSFFEYALWPIHLILYYFFTHNEIFQTKMINQFKDIEKELIEKWENEP